MARMMKKTLVVSLLALFAMTINQARAAETFLAGAAKTDITPDIHKWKVNSIGYFSHKVMTGVHDPVFCTALAVKAGEGEAVIVTCDLMGTPPVLRQKVLEGLKGTGITDDNLLISCSHTHSGPGNMMPNLIARLGFGGYNEELTQWTADQIISAVKEARASMRPAKVRISQTELENVTRNRRDPAGSYNYDTRRFTEAYDPKNPENITDPTLTVIRIDGTDGTPIALLYHFATHGTVLGADNLLISADWMGSARRDIEKAAPGYVVMFMNGAQGDQAPAMDYDDHSDLEYLDIIGGKVAAGVLKIMDKGEQINPTPVRAIMDRVKMPIANKLMGVWVPSWLVRRYFPEMPLQAVRMGDVVFMALPVEAVAEVGLAMKASARGQGVPYPIVAGLANDYGLYCATPEDLREGGYEADNTVFGEVEAGFLIGEQMLLVRELLRDPERAIIR